MYETTVYGETPVCFVLKGVCLLGWTWLDAACPVDNVVIPRNLKFNTVYCDFWLLAIHSANIYCMPMCQAFFKVLRIH